MKIGEFGRFVACSDSDVHPEDRGRIDHASEEIKWMIFELVSLEGEFAVFRCGECTFRGRFSAFSPFPRKPRHLIGDTVRLRDTGDSGVVSGLEWHRVKADYIYSLTQRGRESSKWYFDSDLTD